MSFRTKLRNFSEAARFCHSVSVRAFKPAAAAGETRLAGECGGGARRDLGARQPDLVAGGAESGERVRIDSTVTETHILAPADSRLIFDCIRVLTRLLASARQCLGDTSYPGIIVESSREATRRGQKTHVLQAVPARSSHSGPSRCRPAANGGPAKSMGRVLAKVGGGVHRVTA